MLRTLYAEKMTFSYTEETWKTCFLKCIELCFHRFQTFKPLLTQWHTIFCSPFLYFTTYLHQWMPERRALRKTGLRPFRKVEFDWKDCKLWRLKSFNNGGSKSNAKKAKRLQILGIFRVPALSASTKPLLSSPRVCTP